LYLVTGERRVRLLEADPDLGRFLTAEERTQAGALTVPTASVAQGPVDVTALLERNGCFGAFVLEGMLTCTLRVGEQAGMRILGPGDLVSYGTVPVSMLLAEASCRAVATTRLALLGKDLLVGAHRWPRLVAGLHTRTAEQVERVAVQLAICQLPRVEDRLLALLWLLAESWGRVTPNGTALPVALTHETLGALVGARRPTVTLALGELTDRGAILRQGRTWLLVERPPEPSRPAEEPHAPALVPGAATVWGVREEREPDDAHSVHEQIMATVDRLRLQYEESSTSVRDGLERVRSSRARLDEQRRKRSRGTTAVTQSEAPSGESSR
jgi:CRP-like cAMP-binding protein